MQASPPRAGRHGARPPGRVPVAEASSPVLRGRSLTWHLEAQITRDGRAGPLALRKRDTSGSGRSCAPFCPFFYWAFFWCLRKLHREHEIFIITRCNFPE